MSINLDEDLRDPLSYREDREAIERVYRCMAEQNLDGAMDALYDQFGAALGLAAPHLERRRMGLIARGNAEMRP